MSVSVASGVSYTYPTDEIKVTLEGGGSSIAIGPTNTFYTASAPFKIVNWYLTGYPSGSIQLDIWKKANGIPTVSDSICAGNYPRLISQQQNKDLVLSGWNRDVKTNDTLSISVLSNTGIQNAVLTLKIEKG
jgi:hypothetical protein